ncbi:MAG TPA: hypothetical protein VHM19_05425, partial [Polyangiales bacterium]|nr:hypothetical protein [Polyangiales bacterium]
MQPPVDPPVPAPTATPAPSSTAAPVPAPAPAAVPAPAGPGFWQRLVARPDPLTGLSLTLPVFVLYHLGLLLIEPQRSDSDLITGLMLRLLEESRSAYVIATLLLALVLSVLTWVQHKRGAAQHFAFARVLAESAALAFLLLVTLGWATHRLASGVALTATSALSPIAKVVLACGTGFH